MINPNIERVSLKSIVATDFRGHRLQINEYDDLLEFYLDLDSKFVLAIGRPDVIIPINRKLQQTECLYDVYVSSLDMHKAKDQFLQFWSVFGNLLSLLKLTEAEAVYVYRNRMCGLLELNRDVLSIAEGFSEMLDSHADLFLHDRAVALSEMRVPNRLQPLVKLAMKLNAIDDNLRTELVETLSKVKIQEIVGSVKPLVAEINSFLNSFGDAPLSEEAMYLGALAELVSELEQVQ
ncbi:hypothetical protein [Pedobacter deserti]|uniref:hypothetical protein n=1 Tax=Pedobacter deserti TaxID=2817382 RepID=UPI0021092F00|nr:hypothetical protein [Pedobacter sp. SYSU D00382]